MRFANRYQAGKLLAAVERAAVDYRHGADRIPVGGRTVLVVDDGAATGRTAAAAAGALRRESPERLVLAVPVGPPRTR